MNFGKWIDVHDSQAQRNSFDRAKKAGCTPIELSKEDQYAKFSGDSGIHTTTLSECSCPDFSTKKLPCKHMYRLAMELGMIDAKFETDASKIKPPLPTHSPKQAMKIVVEVIEPDINCLECTYRLVEYGRKYGTCIWWDISEIAPLIDNGMVETELNPTAILKHKSRNEIFADLEKIGYSFPANVETKEAREDYYLSNADEFCQMLYPNARILKASGYINAGVRKIKGYLERRFGFKTQVFDENMNLCYLDIEVDRETEKLLAEIIEKYGEIISGCE